MPHWSPIRQSTTQDMYTPCAISPQWFKDPGRFSSSSHACWPRIWTFQVIVFTKSHFCPDLLLSGVLSLIAGPDASVNDSDSFGRTQPPEASSTSNWMKGKRYRWRELIITREEFRSQSTKFSQVISQTLALEFHYSSNLTAIISFRKFCDSKFLSHSKNIASLCHCVTPPGRVDRDRRCQKKKKDVWLSRALGKYILTYPSASLLNFLCVGWGLEIKFLILTPEITGIGSG